MAFITFSLVLLLSSQHYFTHPSDHACYTPYPCLHTPITILIITPKYFIALSSFNFAFLTLPCHLHHLSLPLIHFQLPPDQHTTHHLQIYYKAPLLILSLLPCHLQRGVHLHRDRAVPYSCCFLMCFKSNECVGLICIGHNGSY